MRLFEPGTIGKLRLKNRVVMAPMGNRFEEPDGRVSQRGIDYFVARARGGVGLIITNGFRVNHKPGGPAVFHAHMLDSKLYINRLNQLAEAVHDYGAKIWVQLQTGMGRTARPGIDEQAAAVSVLPCFWDSKATTREMTIEEIQQVARAYEATAKIARDAGVDGIEIHGHKGAFLDEFMTPLWNKRTDRYGGTLENRLRFPIEVIQAVKKGAGADFPVCYRYGLTHYLEGGREIDEGLEIAPRLEAAGADALSIDAGCEETIYWIHPPTTLPPGCIVDLAAMVKKVVRIPVITVGKLGYPQLAERVLQEGKADFVALGRPLLADPEWPNKVKSGRLDDICPCVGDHEGCEGRVSKRKYLSCTLNPATGMEREFALTPAQRRKNVLVVGGGPAGMEAARIAALRGHRVTLWERATSLGGNLVPGSVPDFKQDYRRLADYLVTQVKKAGVVVKLGQEGTPDAIFRMKPDVVFVATGGTPVVPPVSGVDRPHVVTALDLLSGKKEAGRSVVVIGGGFVGAETALHLARGGRTLTIVEVLDSILATTYRNNRLHMLKLLAESGIRVLTETRVIEIADTGVMVADRSGAQRCLEADTVVIAAGFTPNDGLSRALLGKVPEVYPIGDCVEPRKVINAIWEAFRTARLI